MNQGHVPVALERCVDLLTPAIEYSLINREKTFVIDATLGLGGHAFKILSKFPLVTVIGIDRDQSAIAIARSRLSQYSDRLIIAHNTYDQIAEIAEENQVIHVAGILFDLGVSSMQFYSLNHKFSIKKLSSSAI